MNPDFLAALARQRDWDLRHPAEARHVRDTWRPDLDAREALRRARARVGAALVDLGVHLMVVT